MSRVIRWIVVVLVFGGWGVLTFQSLTHAHDGFEVLGLIIASAFSLVFIVGLSLAIAILGTEWLK